MAVERSHSLTASILIMCSWLVGCGFNNLLLYTAPRIDENHVIKVADFGLMEDVYSRNYFRGKGDRETKLPFKWMALESLADDVFTEKTDVVRT